MRVRHWALAGAAWLCQAGAAYAQTNPLAAISGRVTDPSGAGLGGVAVTAAAAALQGVRSATTSATGDFLVPLLPAGEYEIAFRCPGFRESRARRTLHAAETVRIDLSLELEGATSAVAVSAEPPSVISQAAAVATTYPATLVDRLPVDRSPRGASLLAPGVAATGLGGNVMIAGAMSYENLYLVDGVVVKDRVLGQPRPFPVEDALLETNTTVSGISAEFGRFTGGVVNVVTRSGGNDLSGSLRVTLGSDAWRTLTPYERESLAKDPRADSIVPTYEGTFGGPIVRDQIWYFLAGRWQDTDRAMTLAYTNVPYRYQARETRFEGKATWSPFAGQNLRVAYGRIDTREENQTLSAAMDYASLSPVTTPEDLLSIDVTSTASSNLFAEAQFSNRRRTIIGLGARTTDLLSGTLLRDASRDLVTWNSPMFCGVCGVAPGELRRAEETDRGLVAKLSGFFSGPRIGAHSVVLGGEIADELRRSNSFQSGSGYVVTASAAQLENGSIYPVFLPNSTTVIEWRPISQLSAGSRFRTTSIYVNDSWRLGEHWSFNLGLRWDTDDSRDQSGALVGDSSAWSPRLAAAFDPKGDGAWTVDAGYARYVTSLSFSIGDLGSSAARPARYQYLYNGPAVNAGSGGPLVPTNAALATLFAWFFANQGTLPLRGMTTIPGLSRLIDPGLVLPRTEEITLGATRRFGSRAWVKLSGVRREYSHQYSERVDTSTGRVTDAATGKSFDVHLVGNSDRVKRTYEALMAQADVRLGTALRVAGSYTLSRTVGNFDGDDASDSGGAVPEGDLDFYPEYGEERWRAPSGPLNSDQRHRARLWARYDVSLPARWGSLSVSALERIDSGQAWSVVGPIDSRPYVTNPGYVGGPGLVPYYFEPRGSRRSETASATDLALYYAVSPSALRGVELFTRLVVVNVFGQSAQIRPGNTTVQTAASDPRGGFASFNPFAETPVRGVHWDYAPGFGQALSAADYQQPRTFSAGFGVRF
jgi:hypothetical protein